MKVDLPRIECKPNAKAHPFPAQIAFQAQEFMQGAIFYNILADTASGQRMRQPDALREIENFLIQSGMSKELYEESWGHLKKYQSIFVTSVTQSVLISLRSHWDWYISHLGSFILKQYSHLNTTELSNKEKQALLKIGFKEITQQVDILNSVLASDIELSQHELSQVREMSLVRNLGLHNRWETDEYYLDQTESGEWKLREIRTFETLELEGWHQSLVALIAKTWQPVAIQFNNAPPFHI